MHFTDLVFATFPVSGFLLASASHLLSLLLVLLLLLWLCISIWVLLLLDRKCLWLGFVVTPMPLLLANIDAIITNELKRSW